MWKILVGLTTHRIFLIAIAFVAINQSLQPDVQTALPKIFSFSTLWGEFQKTVSETPEVSAVERLMALPLAEVIRNPPHPFLFLCRLMAGTLGMSAFYTVLFFSNLFLLLFLSELYGIFCRTSTTESAFAGVAFLILWPTTFELSLGSSLSLSCYLSALAVNQSFEQRWFGVGIAVALLSMSDSIVLALLPFLFFIFWTIQRHFPLTQSTKHALFFILPPVLFFFFAQTKWAGSWLGYSGTVPWQLYDAIKTSNTGWIFSNAYLGQTISLLFFLLGGIIGLFAQIDTAYRILPIYWFLAVLFSSSYGTLGSRLILAGISLQPIAQLSAPGLRKVLLLVFLSLGAYEVYFVFR
jgi:hypothetical protein